MLLHSHALSQNFVIQEETQIISHKCKENAGVTFKIFGEAVGTW